VASPFPGMNPYLEHSDRWSTVHNRLIVALADLLTPQLLPKYQVDIEKRVYEVVGINRPHPQPFSSRRRELERRGVATVPVLEEVREAYLEIKEAATQLVVTAIEILSPTNKKSEGRQKYEQKRQQILNSKTHLVEIDLLREGEPLPAIGITVSRYRILISRSNTRPTADLYPFNLTEPIPLFPIPLQPDDPEPTVNLNELLQQIYQRSGYDYFIDYQTDPLLPLSEAERSWIDQELRGQGVR
jgi:hypothetical protein